MDRSRGHPPYSLIFDFGQGSSSSIYVGDPRLYAYANSKKILIETIIKQKIYPLFACELSNIYYLRCSEKHRHNIKIMMRSVKRRNKWPTMRSARDLTARDYSPAKDMRLKLDLYKMFEMMRYGYLWDFNDLMDAEIEHRRDDLAQILRDIMPAGISAGVMQYIDWM